MKEKNKLIVSLLFGLIGFFGSFLSIELKLPDVTLSFIWSLIFPLVVSLAWGRKYAIISSVIGLCGFFPFFVWSNNGWGALVVSPIYIFWFYFNAYFAEKREVYKSTIFNIYIVNIFFFSVLALVYLILLYNISQLNPAFWAPNSKPIRFDVVVAIVVKSILNLTIIVILADVLLHLPFIRTLLKLKEIKAEFNVYLYYTISSIVGIAVWFGFEFLSYFLHYNDMNFDTSSIFNFEFGLTTVLIVAGCLLVTSIIINEINKKQALEYDLLESEVRFKTVFTNSDSIMLVIDPDDLKIFDANPAAAKFYGYSLAEIKSKYIYDLNINPREQLINTAKDILIEKKSKFDSIHKNSKGEEHPVEISSCIISEQGKKKIFSIITDITERVNAQAELKQMNLHLEELVNARTKELEFAMLDLQVANYEMSEVNDALKQESKKLNETNVKLERSESELKATIAEKNKFFSIIAHDLRNPIGFFGQMTETILYQIDKIDKDEINYLIKMLDKAAKQSFDLLSNLLEWANSQTGRMLFNPSNNELYPIAAQVIQSFGIISNNKEITIQNKIDEKIICLFDKQMITTVFRNLISNAIKFTPRGGTIKVQATEDENMVIVDVIDSGLGMSAELVNKLFKIDEKVTSIGTEKEKGTGLGLILCKDLIERNGGGITVISSPGKGSTFRFILQKQLDNL